MERLKISLVPVTGRIRAAGPGQTIEDQIFMQQVVGEPHYYWTLDMPTPDPTKIAAHLLSMITRREEQEIIPLDHCFPNTGSGTICGPQRYFYGSPVYFSYIFLFLISDNFKTFSTNIPKNANIFIN